MASYRQDFPFNIMDVASLLRLQIRRPMSNRHLMSNSTSVYVDCPFCNKRGKMNLNRQKNVYRCNYCNEGDGMLALYANLHGISKSDAYREIRDTLQTGGQAPEHETKTAREPPAVQNSLLAGIHDIHQTMTLLLSMLHLSDSHRKNLRNRGLTDEQIDHLGYKSTPPPSLCLSLTQRLLNQGCMVQGVPGFYLKDNGKWTVKFHKRTAGILLPARGMDGLIRGAQIRLDVPFKDEDEDEDKEGTKYLWLSSINKHMGVTSGSPVHFIGDSFAQVIYVTEGILKADIAHHLMNRSFVAVAGANNLSQLDPVFSVLAHNGTKLIVEAHDMDKFRNKEIDKGASRIYVMARKYGMESKRLTWNPNYKGVDDWQYALKKKKEAMNKEGCKLNFKEKFLSGQCGFDHIDDCIEAWHNGPEEDKPLHEYLGLTEQEYYEYLRGEDLEKRLVTQRKQQGFRIYQLDFSEDIHPKKFAFLGIKALYKAGYEQPPASLYRLVHDAEIFCSTARSDKEILELIFSKYNDNMPEDYHGRSISPSDVIELYDKVQRQYFYRDQGNFIEVKFSPGLALPMKKQK